MFQQVDNGAWLDEVADLCITTLNKLNTKVQEGDVTQDDTVLRDICLGYLYMLSICNDEGLISKSILSDNFKRNITIH